MSPLGSNMIVRLKKDQPWPRDFDNTQYPTAWQNFRYDIYDWISSHGVIFAVALSVIMFALVTL